jgi:hypothetical protein
MYKHTYKHTNILTYRTGSGNFLNTGDPNGSECGGGGINPIMHLTQGMSELTSVHLSTRTQSVVFRTPNRTDLLLLALLSLALFSAVQLQSSIRNNNAKFLVSYKNLINYFNIKF